MNLYSVVGTYPKTDFILILENLLDSYFLKWNELMFKIDFWVYPLKINKIEEQSSNKAVSGT